MFKIINCNLLECDAEVVCHQVNCRGIMEYGIAKQICDRYPEVYPAYKKSCDEAAPDSKKLLGTIQEVVVARKRDKSKTKIICNIFGQDNYSGSGVCFIDYNALKSCLEKIKEKYKNMSIAIPYRMACSLVGGDWRVEEEMILEILDGCDVTICRFNNI